MVVRRTGRVTWGVSHATVKIFALALAICGQALPKSGSALIAEAPAAWTPTGSFGIRNRCSSDVIKPVSISARRGDTVATIVLPANHGIAADRPIAVDGALEPGFNTGPVGPERFSLADNTLTYPLTSPAETATPTPEDPEGITVRSWRECAPAEPGEFLDPTDAAIEPATGNIVVSDSGNDRVQVLASGGVPVSQIGPFAQGDDRRLDRPRGVSVDATGKVLVADRGHHRVVIFNPDGSLAGTLGTPFDPSHPLAAEDNDDPNAPGYVDEEAFNRLQPGVFYVPMKVAIKPGTRVLDPEDTAGRIAVLDEGHNRVQVFDSELHHLYSFGRRGLHGNRPGQLNLAGDLALDANGRFFVTDAKHPHGGRVNVFQELASGLSATFIHAFNTTSGAAPGTLEAPWGVAAGPDGRIFVGDRAQQRVHLFDENGSYELSFGGAGNGPGQFLGIMGLAYDPATERLYAVDRLSGRLSVFSASGDALASAPVTQPDAYDTNEDVALTVAAPGVLANDSGPEGSTLTAALVDGAAHGTVALHSDGSFSYVPGPNFNGNDSFTYHASDGTTDGNTATVSITVNAVNDPPSATADSYTTNEDITLTVPAPGVLGNDTDLEGGLAAVLVNGPTKGTLTLHADGSFTYVPNANVNGTDTFTYQATDGSATSSDATVTITIVAVNDAPVAHDDSYTLNEDQVPPLSVPAPGVLANDTDVDGPGTPGTMTAVFVRQDPPPPGAFVLQLNGSFTFLPQLNFNGTVSFSYRVRDGAGAESNIATVTFTVNPVNDAPVAVANSYTTSEDTELSVPAPGVLGNDTDVDANTLTAVLVTAPTKGSFSLASNGSFRYTPTENVNGTDSFTYRANDGTVNSNVATVTITITAVNDPPLAAPDGYSTSEDTPLTVAAPGVLGNDSDVEGSALIAALVSGPGHGSVTLNPNGSFTYTPALDFNGIDSFSYRPNDGTANGTANGNVAAVTLTVNAVNDRPVASGFSIATDEDTPTTLDLLAHVSDVDDTRLTIAIASAPAHGTLTPGGGSFTYVPAANYYGPDSFAFTASDGKAESDPATVNISVRPLNDAPVATADSYTTNEDAMLMVAAPGVLGNDTDVDSTALNAIPGNQPAHGTVALGGNGSFIYTPAPDFHGADSFTYRASDGSAASAEVTVSITVDPVNDAPLCVAAPPVQILRPPNHNFVPISILGVTDRDGDPIALIVTRILQDEPTARRHFDVDRRKDDKDWGDDGDFAFERRAVDGLGVGTAMAQVRAERDDKGDGRIYEIFFTANDGHGGACAGMVTVGVPRDRRRGSMLVDSGVRYDSTVAAGPPVSGTPPGPLHRRDDGCDHERRRNGHRDGDGCEHERELERHDEDDDGR